MRNSATTVVRLIVEVTPSDRWGEDATIAQIKKQGTESALAHIQRVVEKADGRVRVVEVHSVRTFINEEKA